MSLLLLFLFVFNLSLLSFYLYISLKYRSRSSPAQTCCFPDITESSAALSFCNWIQSKHIQSWPLLETLDSLGYFYIFIFLFLDDLVLSRFENPSGIIFCQSIFYLWMPTWYIYLNARWRNHLKFSLTKMGLSIPPSPSLYFPSVLCFRSGFTITSSQVKYLVNFSVYLSSLHTFQALTNFSILLPNILHLFTSIHCYQYI